MNSYSKTYQQERRKLFTQLNVEMTHEVKQKIKDAAKAKGISASELVRYATLTYIEKMEVE